MDNRGRHSAVNLHQTAADWLHGSSLFLPDIITLVHWRSRHKDNQLNPKLAGVWNKIDDISVTSALTASFTFASRALGRSWTSAGWARSEQSPSHMEPTKTCIVRCCGNSWLRWWVTGWQAGRIVSYTQVFLSYAPLFFFLQALKDSLVLQKP